MKKNKFYPLAGTAVFLLDQWIKDYVEKNLKMGEKRKLAEKLELRRVHNPGICLGVFANKPEKVKKLTEAGTGIVTVTQMLTLLGNNHVLKKAGITLAAAGAWSNLADRYHKEKVVDYIGIKTEKKKLEQVTYNLGDFAIGAGGVLWFLVLCLRKKEQNYDSGYTATSV